MPDPVTPSGIVAGQWTVETAMAHILEVIVLNDKRYEERFQSSQTALAVNFTGQEKANAIALAAVKEAGATSLAAADRAVAKAETANEKRFDGVNEFRQTLADQQRNLMPRSEAEIQIKTLQDRVNALEKVRNEQRGSSAGQHDLWGYIVGAIGIAAAIVAIGSKF